MATLDLQGTKFTFSVLPKKRFSKGYWAITRIEIENEYTSYKVTSKDITRAELEEWIFAMFRLLAGAYPKEHTVSFERAKLSVGLHPHTKDGEEVSRAERRKNDCVMSIQLLMRSANQKGFLGGVYSILLHRKEIEKFATALREEFNNAFVHLEHGRGKYLFAGVSPLGYKGCNYWYFDPSNMVKAGDYVWVCMGRHNTEQIVYVDSIRYFSDETTPFDPAKVKRILRKATDEEINKQISLL